MSATKAILAGLESLTVESVLVIPTDFWKDISWEAERKWALNAYGEFLRPISPLTNYKMSVTEAIHLHDTGSLISISTMKLQLLFQLLDNKVDYLERVVKSQAAADEVKEDLRKCSEVKNEVARLIESRMSTII